MRSIAPYDLVWTGQLNEAGYAAKLVYQDVADSNVRQVNESIDGGNLWQISPDRRIFYRVYGTYSSPGATYTVTRIYATRVSIVLQSGAAAQSRINASVPC